MSGFVGSLILISFLAGQNVQKVEGIPVTANNCARTITLKTGLDCKGVIAECQTSPSYSEKLAKLNGYPDLQTMCFEQFPADTKICCESLDEPDPLPESDCVRTIESESALGCDGAAHLYETDVATLSSLNGYHDATAMCSQQFQPHKRFCCEGPLNRLSKAANDTREPDALKRCNQFCPSAESSACAVKNGRLANMFPNKCVCEFAKCNNPRAIDECLSRKRCDDFESVRCRSSCKRNCPVTYNPVCGSDGVTYYNRCFLDRETCCQGKPMFDHWGECRRKGFNHRLCEQTICPETNATICGSDGVTYGSLCHLEKESCINPSKDLHKIGEGPCRQGQISPCVDKCPQVISPVCGTNNVTYVNSCYLSLHACRFPDEVIALRGTGNCEPERKEQSLGLGLLVGGLIGGAVGFDIGLGTGSLLGSNVCFERQGTLCKFPFKFRNNVYTGCTSDFFFFPWCATEVDAQQNAIRRGFCGLGCGVGNDLRI